MPVLILSLFSSLACAAPAPAPPQAIVLTPDQALEIGKKVWRNESAGAMTRDLLTHWNEGEDFASLGIGHFLWYHEGAPGPFTESFPPVVAALEAGGIAVPVWLKGPCPWKSRDEFYKDFRSAKMEALRKLLEDTFSIQAMVIARRTEDALPKMLATLPLADRDQVSRRFYAVAADPAGVFALVDYVNFKGEGTNPTESYNGQGWGLLQVLQEMQDAPPGMPSVQSFATAADAVLTRRVSNAPPARHEERWLRGWKNRIKRYVNP